ncbi:MAG: transaldolase [Ignavibacteriae bacterium]|nr:transaldolase [Ignavibacteriota bacterium]
MGNSLDKLKIKIFADGANVKDMIKLYRDGLVKGFTTNPTLMKKDGVQNYEAFAKEVLSVIKDLPISFEVFSDDFDLMEKEARKIQSWGNNVNVKIPITNTKGELSTGLIKKLSADGMQLNITAILTLEQVEAVAQAISPEVKSIVSVFAGRIADTGRDPIPYMKKSYEILSDLPNAELLWASPRELLNIFHAEDCGCKIITVTNDLLKKLSMVDRNLKDLSLDTVKMFANDAATAGYRILD